MTIARLSGVVLLALAPCASAEPCAPLLDDPLPDVPLADAVVSLEVVACGLGFPRTPTDLEPLPDGSGRSLVAGLGGVVSILGPDGSVTDLLDTRNAATEINPLKFGMVSVVAHPEFATPGHAGFGAIYVQTTEAPNSAPADFIGFGNSHQDVLTEWRFDTELALIDPGSAREVLRIGQVGVDHNLSDMAFLPDGTLLLALGDGANQPPGQTGASDKAQLLTDIRGSILRIDPLGLIGTPVPSGRYAIPVDNPFVGVAGVVEEIWAYGVRSPYRLTVDPDSGEVFVGDVGQLSIEEITRIQAGGNHGWNRKEGSFLFDTVEFGVCPDDAPDPLLVDPVAEYDHDDGRSIVVGHRAADGAIAGRLVCADFQGDQSIIQGDAKLWLVDPDAGTIHKLPVDPAGTALPDLVYSIGRDAAGALYVLGGPADGSDACILRLAAGCAALPADVTGDGAVNLEDLNLVLAGFGTATDGGDATGDGLVDLEDLNAVLAAFGAACR